MKRIPFAAMAHSSGTGSRSDYTIWEQKCMKELWLWDAGKAFEASSLCWEGGSDDETLILVLHFLNFAPSPKDKALSKYH